MRQVHRAGSLAGSKPGPEGGATVLRAGSKGYGIPCDGDGEESPGKGGFGAGL